MSDSLLPQDKPEVPVSPEVTALRAKFTAKGGFDKEALAAVTVVAFDKFHSIYPLYPETLSIHDAVRKLEGDEKHRLLRIAKAALEPFLPPDPPAPTGPMGLICASELDAFMKRTTQAERDERKARAEDWDTRKAAFDEIGDCIWDTWNAQILRLRNERIMAGTAGKRDLQMEPMAYPLRNSEDALAALNPKEAIVEGLLERGTITIAWGASNSGKTTVLQWMLHCVAANRNFGERRVMQGKCIWVAAEDYYNAEIRRQLYIDLSGDDRKVIDDNLLILPESVAIMDPRSLKRIHQAIEQRGWAAKGVLSAIGFDSKSTSWGGENENSNDENTEFCKLLDFEFTERYGCAVIATHHGTKGNDKNDPTARGAGSLINNVTQEWKFEKVTGGAKMHPGKLRSASWEPIFARITTHEPAGARYEHLRNSMGLMPTVSIAEITNIFGVVGAKVVSKKDDEFARILEAFKINVNESKASIAEHAGLTRIDKDGKYRGDTTKVTSRLEAMALQGLVCKVDEKKSRSGYVITDAGNKLYDDWKASQNGVGDSENDGENQDEFPGE